MIKFYPNGYEFDLKKQFVGKALPDYDTKIVINDNDTLKAAQKLINPCCLNFASHKRPGGGYKSVINLAMPIKTQEEDLFRRSNLPELMDVPLIRNRYPLKKLEGMFTTGIVVEKDEKLNRIEPFAITMITVPAVVNPQPEDQQLVKDKIERILDIAAENSVQNLVLGAWGCGIFNNDPKNIANLFKNYLTNEFKGIFENVIFGIPNAKSKNYQIFEEVLRA